MNNPTNDTQSIGKMTVGDWLYWLNKAQEHKGK